MQHVDIWVPFRSLSDIKQPPKKIKSNLIRNVDITINGGEPMFFPFFSQINECLPSPCQHSSKCLDLINTYKCHCSDGFTGTNCEKGMNKK
jgi:hypothetical protein